LSVRHTGFIRATTVVPVTDAFVNTVAHLRFGCRSTVRSPSPPLHFDLWIAATAIHIGAQLVTADNLTQ
jgi:predicted nucleic acid-binding protein